MKEKIIYIHLPMKYGDKNISIIGRGKINGYEYEIKNINGNHPTAYVKLPKNHVYYNIYYDDIPVYVHGGLTYSEMKDSGYWIGWDYAHCGDYTNFELFSNEKRWTTEEILNHVVDVISQLSHIDRIEKSEALTRHLKDYKLQLIKVFLDMENQLTQNGEKE